MTLLLLLLADVFERFALYKVIHQIAWQTFIASTKSSCLIFPKHRQNHYLSHKHLNYTIIQLIRMTLINTQC